MVVDLAIFRPRQRLPAAQAHGLDRVLILHHPGTHVKQVHVLLNVEVT